MQKIPEFFKILGYYFIHKLSTGIYATCEKFGGKCVVPLYTTIYTIDTIPFDQSRPHFIDKLSTTVDNIAIILGVLRRMLFFPRIF